MYCSFYGLKERPFNVTSDPAFFFSSRKHQEALSHLFYGATQRKGIIVITGEIGTGKTTLCRFFLEQISANTKTALILNPFLSEIQLLEAIIKDFGLSVHDKNRLSYTLEFNKFLLKEAREGNNVVLIIDEAQNLKSRQLEQIRLLSNLETQKDKLMQIVLVGQPELNHKLNLYELRQIRQRVMVRYHIMPLDKDEVNHYINHRLTIAGSRGRIKFSDEAIKTVCESSSGIPRLINIICDRALLAGFVNETYAIDIDIIKRSVEELGSFALEAR
ncbi:MAG: AAA family ATPase [Candidatus Omnitrophota bacterium]